MSNGWDFLGDAIGGLFGGIADWLTSENETEAEDRRMQLMTQLDRERRRLPNWAYAKLKNLLSTGPTPHGQPSAPPVGAKQPYVSPDAWMGAYQQPRGQGSGGAYQRAMTQRISPHLPKDNIRNFLTR